MTVTELSVEATLSAQVAAEIRAWMGRLNVRQSELARRLGETDQWVSMRLKGKTPIDLNELQRIADALGISPGRLFPGAPEGHSVISVGARREKITRAYPRITKQPTPPGRPTRTHQHSSTRRTVRLSSTQRPAS